MEIVKKFDIDNWSQKITCYNCTTELIIKIDDFQKDCNEKLYIECPVCKCTNYCVREIKPNFVIQTADSLIKYDYTKF
jgi:hypothetical protein